MFNFSRRFFSEAYRKSMTTEGMKKGVLDCRYAVRGTVPIRGEQITKILTTGMAQDFPFEKTVQCNIGNPQALKSPPITFNREVNRTQVNVP